MKKRELRIGSSISVNCGVKKLTPRDGEDSAAFDIECHQSASSAQDSFIESKRKKGVVREKSPYRRQIILPTEGLPSED